MTGKEKFRRLLKGEVIPEPAFWLGSPVEETLRKYCDYFQTTDRLSLAHHLNEDVYHVFIGGGEDFHSVDKALTQVEDSGMAVLSGLWSCFFHNVADHFGMEEFFIKSYTAPDEVMEEIQKWADYYVDGNRRFFDLFANRIDAFFMANDFGTQISLLISPKFFEQFILPTYRRLIDLAHNYNLPVLVHSCGAIAPLIPTLIQAGIDGLHPLQALAAGMDAVSLKKIVGDRLLLMGGIDTQQLLPFGTPEEIKREVKRVMGVLGPRYIVSPSHEGLLPNISPEAIIAMREACRSF